MAATKPRVAEKSSVPHPRSSAHLGSHISDFCEHRSIASRFHPGPTQAEAEQRALRHARHAGFVIPERAGQPSLRFYVWGLHSPQKSWGSV